MNNKKTCPDVPESLLGYLYQVYYSLYFALINDNDDIGIFIEKLDDIQVKKDNNKIELVQSKRSPSLSDKSPNLWKTIRNWSIHIKNETIFLKDVTFFIITTAKIQKNSIASLLGDNNRRGPDRALDELIKCTKESKSEELKQCFNAFLELTESQRLALVKQIYIVGESPDIDKLETKIINYFKGVKQVHRSCVFKKTISWWMKEVIKHLSNRSETPIKKSLIEDKISEIADEYKTDNLPIFNIDEIECNVGQDNRPFVLHLKKITNNRKKIEYAVLDHHKAVNHRLKWANENLLVIGEIDNYQDKLVREWGNKVIDVLEHFLLKAFSENDKRAKGSKIYKEVMELDLCIRPRVTEKFIMRGNYHILADEDKICWHPDEQLIQEQLEEL